MKKRSSATKKKPAKREHSPASQVDGTHPLPLHLCETYHPSTSYQGEREDYAFMHGPRGWGYYLDPKIFGDIAISSDNEHDEEVLLAEAMRQSLAAREPTPEATAERLFFERFAAQNAFVMHTVTGDGHCLFRCAYHLFGRIGHPDGRHYRSVVAKMMREDAQRYIEWQIIDEFGRDRIEVPTKDEYERYVDALERGQNSLGGVVYGDYLSLLALADRYRVVLRVVNGDGSVAAVPDPEPPDVTVHYLSFHIHMYSGHHYNLLLPAPVGAPQTRIPEKPPPAATLPERRTANVVGTAATVGDVSHPKHRCVEESGGTPPAKEEKRVSQFAGKYASSTHRAPSPVNFDPASLPLHQERPVTGLVSQFAKKGSTSTQRRRLKPSACTLTVICASQNEPHTEIGTSERLYRCFGKAVSEVRDTLKALGRSVTWAARCDNSYNRCITTTEQQDVLGSVLDCHPRGALFCLLQEANAFTANFNRELAEGRIMKIPSRRQDAQTRSYMTPKGVPFTAPSQQFRSTDVEPQGTESTSNESRRCVQQILDAQPVKVRRCRFCSAILLGSSQDSLFAEKDIFCCGFGARRHDPWHALPNSFDSMVFTKVARVVNCLLSPTTIHGDAGEGIGYRHLSYQAPVMTINGQLYSRFMRNPSNCWFLHDAKYDQRLYDLFRNSEQKEVLTQFHKLLVKEHSFRKLLRDGWNVQDIMREDTRVWVTLDEDTRLCAVYVSSNACELTGRRQLYVLGANTTIAEDQPEWELLAYPIMHYRGDITKAWFPGKKSITGQPLKLGQYLRSVIMTQPGFWRYGRLAEQFVLDTWARQEQMSLAAMKSETVQRRLRDYARACGRSFGPEKIFLPSSVPGSYAYQRKFFHDVLHMSRTLGASHLFVTFTCNPNWPEIQRIVGGTGLGGAVNPPDFSCESFQDKIARVFVSKRRQLMHRLTKSTDYLFPGHRGAVWAVYCTEWQKGDLPHAHIAVRLDIDTTVQPMATLHDQLELMEKIVCAQKPPPAASHYHQVIAFMQHPEVCKSCLQPIKGSGTDEKRCRFRFPKPENDQARVDMKGFPVYIRGPHDVRIVPYNAKTLLEFNCHVNFEYTFLSHHFGYLYKYMVKAIDHGGFRIRDQNDEIAAHHRARILTPAETVYKSLGFNVNYRNPAVVVCHIHLPRSRNSAHGEAPFSEFDPLIADEGGDVFGEQFGEGDEDVEHAPRTRPLRGDTGHVEFSVDYLEEYFKADREDEILFCQFYEQYYGRFVSHSQKVTGFENYPDVKEAIWMWLPRKKANRILARMPWYPPTSGPIYFLRVLLLHVPARSFNDLFGGFSSFKEHCLHLNLIDDGEEYLHGMRDAIESGRSPAECRHLFALFMNCMDTLHLGALWADTKIRNYLLDDFLPSEANGDVVDGSREEIFETAAVFALMDIASMIDGMGTDEFLALFVSKGIPEPAALHSMELIHGKLNNNVSCARVFRAYATVVGYSVTRRAVIPLSDREVVRFREKTNVLTTEALAVEVEKLNHEQRRLYEIMVDSFRIHVEKNRRSLPNEPCNYLHNINASAGCGKTFLLNRIIAAVRMMGHITVSVCSIGIGALHFDDGRTVHNMFKIPIKEEKDVIEGLTLISTLNSLLDMGKTNGRIEFLKRTDFISWDEIGTMKNNVFLAVSHLMQRIKGNSLPFGGCFVITVGDWKQCPPVDDDNERVRFWDGDEEAFCSIANLSVKTCRVFTDNFSRHRLQLNERARFDPPFAEFVRCIGVGHHRGNVPLNTFKLRVFHTVEESCQWLYETDIPEPYHSVTVSERCILSPYNRTVDMINEHCEQECSRIRGKHFRLVELLSADEFICAKEDSDERKKCFQHSGTAHVHRAEVKNLRADLEGHDNTRAAVEDGDFLFDVQNAVENTRLEPEDLSTEILNVMDFKNTPPHRLRLYVGCTVILLRNLDPANRLQNGVRLIVKDFIRNNKVIAVTKAEDEKKFLLQQGEAPKEFLLHRIKFECRSGKQDAVVTRKQFPVRVANAVSVHKSQSMTMGRTVFDVRDGVFEHGQCFVALSRNRQAQDLALLVRPGQITFRNIVLDMFVDDE